MEPRDVLAAGSRELQGLLAPQGFVFRLTDEGASSGGRYASGLFERGARRLELHVRWSLGLVTYHSGALALGHSEYVRAVQGLSGTTERASYPGFSNEPMESFRCLRQDLERFGGAFVSGTDIEFAVLHRWATEHPAPRGFAAGR
jgi:hypothetical protein